MKSGYDKEFLLGIICIQRTPGLAKPRFRVISI